MVMIVFSFRKLCSNHLSVLAGALGICTSHELRLCDRLPGGSCAGFLLAILQCGRLCNIHRVILLAWEMFRTEAPGRA